MISAWWPRCRILRQRCAPFMTTSMKKSGNEAVPSPSRQRSRKTIPRYATIELIDRSGQQRFVIHNGRILQPAELRDVSKPANTRFKSETYFSETAKLKKGEIHVSHLTGFHVGKKEQLGSAPDSESAFGGREYEGVIRFATPLFEDRGQIQRHHCTVA